MNLHFVHADFISIIGPSDSDKSKLLSLIGTLIPIRLVRNIKPYETMQSGEVSKGRRLSVGMSLNQLVTYWPRTTLSILAIALPTSLFGFLLFVTFRLRGVLYTT
ncbi:hypothetical protein [Exiguobacterium sp. SH0S7]|uniref:hypothetical protein n=1 Tax=Exiguobacterium sp. SH0S7 TaxID=2510951 RepID=UPI0013151A97|nr:hypothetical protein [Exiguobacterium sp. SH0S7]